MDVRELILKELSKKPQLRVADIVKKTGFSRAYVSRFFKQLKDEGKIVLFGKANKAFYVKSDEKSVIEAKRTIKTVSYTHLRAHET